jgi:hypothetical protein
MRKMTNSTGSTGVSPIKPFNRRVLISIHVVFGLLLSSCASHPRLTAPPQLLELYSEARVATLHFPSGTYSLSSEDRRGYYYRARGGVIENTAAGRRRRDGGIFVSKHDQRKLRGFVIMPYGLTHVGNLSHTEHEFHGEREVAAPAAYEGF